MDKSDDNIIISLFIYLLYDDTFTGNPILVRVYQKVKTVLIEPKQSYMVSNGDKRYTFKVVQLELHNTE